MTRILKPRVTRFIIGGLTALGPYSSALAQGTTVAVGGPTVTVIIRNVHVIPMDRDRVVAGQTVVIEGDRIVSIGTAAEIPVPDGATVIDGAGRYLLPGLTDAHVHLEAWAGARPDFGDAPLYLAHGVTTVINLRGTPEFFDWRRRVQAGELLGPTIYTAGEFIIGPRGPTLRDESGNVLVGPNATTPEDTEREVTRQVNDGVDVIKYYGGLSRAAYFRMAQAAREQGVPIVGHRPLNLGFDDLLEARQPLAHVYMLSNLYFWPMFSSRGYLLATAGSVAILVLVVAGWWRPTTRAVSRARAVTRILLLLFLLPVLVVIDGFTLNRLALESTALFRLLTALAVLGGFATIVLAALSVRIWRESSTPRRARLMSAVAATAGVVLIITFATFWVPVSFRSTPAGIDAMARRLHDAGISVQTTMIAFEGLTMRADDLRARQDDPGMEYLDPGLRQSWRQLPMRQAPIVSPSAFEFMKGVTASLHRAGVPLVAGTDALGAPLIFPGTSLHRELQLLVECGLTPWEAIRTATVNPAAFLGRSPEFGMVAVGMRADLLLVEENPLQDPETLREPAGVMIRGMWFTREELQRMLVALRAPT